MSRTPKETGCPVIILKCANVLVGFINWMVSFGYVFMMFTIAKILTPTVSVGLSSIMITSILIWILLLAQLFFDFLFIYSIFKEHLVVVKMYSYASVVRLILLTMWVLFMHVKDIYYISLIVFLYGLYISSFALSYCYDSKFEDREEV